ncbi:MAG TPA: glycosyltransferase family 4 protein [Solirubrobacteraceae bacterium]|nr:glycosyltransferase family 4 protein [Solirubrobacteraceae bacterium]
MRVCLVYDCLYPHTVGGAERWYRNLAERLARAGHEVTYLTLRQWERGEEPAPIAGVRIIAVGPRLPLYVEGRRAIWPPLRFGWGVWLHLARHGRRYDVVHTASFPYFSLLAAALARPRGRYSLIADWHEVWSDQYWREYLGAAGWFGIAVQRICARVRQRAFCFSRLHAQRLQREGLRGEVTVLEGEYAGPLEPAAPEPPEPVVVFAGRLIPEKRAPSVVPAVALAAAQVPGLRGVIYGDGPDRAAVAEAIAALDDPGQVSAPGFVDAAELHAALRRSLAMVLPSRREGYGLVVVEAAQCGIPSIVVSEADNAAVELVQAGVNGVIAASAEPQALAAAIVEVHRGGEAMRASTREWFAANAQRLSLEHSLETVLAAYAAEAARA